MGFPIPETPEYGNDCNVLKPGGGRLFPIGETPRIIRLAVSGLENCTGGLCGTSDKPPNGRVYTLEQQIPQFCEWKYSSGFESALWFPNWGSPPRTVCRIARDGVCYWFDTSGFFLPPAKIAFPNPSPCSNPFMSASSGNATLTWDSKIKDIANQMHFQPSPNTLYDFFYLSETEQVIKLCNLESPTNVKFKINIADFY